MIRELVTFLGLSTDAMEVDNTSGRRDQLATIGTGYSDSAFGECSIVPPVTNGHEVVRCPGVKNGLSGMTIVLIPCLEGYSYMW